MRRIREEERGRTSFAYLDAPQLVKHMLGLTIGFGPAGFDFAYLYYEMSSPEAKKHRRELEEFKRQIGDEVRFRDMTYQELFAAIRRCGGAGGDYVSYLAERYFPCLGD